MTAIKNLTWRTLAQLLGSKSFLDLKTLVVTVLPLMMTASLIASGSTTLAEMSIWISGNVVIYLVLALLVVFLHRVIYGNNPTLVIPLFFVIAISTGLGAIKGLIITFWVRTADPLLMSESEATAAILINTILGIPAFLLSSAVALALANLKLHQINATVVKNLQLLRRSSDRNRKKIESICWKLSKLVQRLESAQTNSVQSKVIEQLRKILDSEIRPLTHELFRQRGVEENVTDIGPLSKLAISSRASAVGPAVAMIFFIPHGISWLGLASGLMFSLSSSVAIFVTISLANQISIKLGQKGPVVHIISAAILPTLVSAAILTLTTNQTFLAPLFSFFVPIWLLQVSFLISLLREIIQAQATTEISALGISTQDQIGASFRSQKTSREVAQQLHGSVQAKLLRLITISKGEGVVSNKEMVKQLQEILTLLDQGEQPARDLKFEIVKLQQAWEGFIETEITVDSLGEILPIGSLVEILQELILNSYRHGGAQKITVSATEDTIIAEDDGSYQVAAKPGLGSLLFDSVCRDWHIQQTATGGTRVELRLQQMMTLDL
jgi:hypothetical protein